jgi:predicted transcriptional regulator
MFRFSFSERLILSQLSQSNKSFDAMSESLRGDFPEFALRVLLHNLFERKAIIRNGNCYRLRESVKV